MTKTLQIMRVDHDLVQKANLQIGNNIIGRGVATGCNDEQVLKHALIINLSPNDEMTITPMVPCYMKASGCIRWQPLKLKSCTPIKPGDVCSLLPDKCWFKIISVPETMEKNDQTLKRKVDEDSSNEVEGKKICLSLNNEQEAVMSSIEPLNDFLNGKKSPAECVNPTINGNYECSNVSMPILQEIHSSSCPEGSDVSATCSKMLPNFQDVAESSTECESNTKGKKNINLMNNVAASTESEEKTKLNHDVDLNDHVEAASPIEDESQSPIATRQNQANVSDHEDSKLPKREKCKYGTRCYRRNPNHKNNYSHPGDADYDEADDREECPFGLKCYRKNPQHKAQFKHTRIPRRRRAAAVAAAAAASRQPVVVDTETDASSMESVDESDYEPSVYTESSDTKSDSDDSRSEWEDGTTG